MIGLSMLTIYSGKILQTALNENGAKLVIDGKIGPLSVQAVIDFQIKNKLPLTDQIDVLLDALDLDYTLSLKKRKVEAPEKDRPDAPEIKPPKPSKPGKHVYKKELWIDNAKIGPSVVVKGAYATKTGRLLVL